jgi:nitronate monooxygenase
MICAGSHAQEGGLDGLVQLIRQCRRLTDKPIGVNFLLLNSGEDYMQTARVIVDEGVRVVETAGRAPSKELLALFKGAGVFVIHKCTTIRHALAAERAGVDAVEVAGFDLGGHPGETDVGNWVLLAKAGKTLSLPWIAAGGIATGTQLAAALALGAAGVNMGTRFLATQECRVGGEIKQAIVDGTEHDTELLMRGYSTLRVFKNAAAKEARRLEAEQPAAHAKNDRFRALVADGPGALTRQVLQGAIAQDNGVWSAGQAMGLIDDVPTCQDLISAVVAEAADALSKSMAMVSVSAVGGAGAGSRGARL